MKVFISGMAGFLGSHLADRFLEKGWEVSGCDNLIGGYEGNVPDNATLYKSDCSSLSEMNYVLNMEKPDVVYHCAAIACEGLSVFSPHIISNSIYMGTVGILTASIKNGVKRFVNTSSMARYGAIEIPFTEDMKCEPQDPYGIAKRSVEDVVKNMCETHGVEYVNMVPHNIIGPRQKFDDPYRNVASIMINRMLQGKQPIIYGDGLQSRCFSFVQDCISCLEKAATLDVVVGETINIGPDEEFVTIKDLAYKIADLLDFKIDPIYITGRPREVKYATCSSDKARDLLGYKTTYTLDRGLREMIDWIKEKGPKPFNYHLPIEIEKGVPETWNKKLL